MKFGLRPIEGGQSFDATREQVVAAESLGFDSVWFAEHYTDDEHWWPASLVNLATLAGCTDDITLGTNVLVTPFYNPVWLASAVAMLDVTSDGRVVCGLGVGYDAEEYAALGIPMDERVGRTIESLILLKRLWTEDAVSFDGSHFAVDEFGISPKPVQEPRPEVWLGVWGDYLLGQAATRADAWIPGAVADLDQLRERRAIYDDGLDGEPATRPLLRDVVLGESRRDALERARRYLGPKYEVYAERGHQFFGDYEAADFESFVADRVVLGTPSQCVDQIERFRDELDLDHLVFRFNYRGMDAATVQADMETIATEVLPSFG
jgi:alkanesulfonate monooxygenase SsuD/methylene tetrahydromethanopterin reductase-like flavin-dependent oxidoreductase (luciferase family)